MLSRDLFASVIKTFFEELDDVRDGGDKGKQGNVYAVFYSTYFGRERDWFLQASVQDITTFLVDDPIHKLEMLAELMFRDIRTLSDAEIQAIMYRKIIEVYDWIDTKSQDFSMERMNRVAEIKGLLEEIKL